MHLLARACGIAVAMHAQRCSGSNFVGSYSAHASPHSASPPDDTCPAFKYGLGLISAAVFGLFIAHAAKAQEINYGALSEIFGEPVTTSATGLPEKASDVPADMEIITADEIRRSGATDIPDILRYYAGIDVRSEGALDNDVSIRGYAQPFNPRLLVLIDGRQVYLDDYGYTPWQTLPVQLADIRQIEVVRGPASALFGFNAASGVINIITYDPLFDKTNVLNFGFGSDGTYTGSLVSTLNVPGKGGITVQLGGLKTNEYSQAEVQYQPAPDAGRPFEGDYAVDARYKPTDETEVTLEATQSNAVSSVQNTAYAYFRQSYRINSYKAGISAATNIGLVNLLAYTNLAKTAYTDPTTENFDNNQIDVIQLSDLFKLADVHSFRIGVEYRNNRGSDGLFVGTLHYNVFAANGMWNWQIVPDLSFTAAGRLDHLQLLRVDPLSSDDVYTPSDYNHAAFTVPSYNLGLVWQPTNYDTFRLLNGRAVQAPSLFDFGFDIQVPAGPISLILGGNPNLKPSSTTNYEADYDREIAPISSTLRCAVFFNTTTDLIAFGSNLPGHFADGSVQVYSGNTGNGQAAGGEIGLSGANAAGLRWDASYALVGVRNKIATAPAISLLSFNNNTPTSEVDLGGGYSWHQWEADAQAHWQSNYQVTTELVGHGNNNDVPVTVNNYVTVSARIGYAVNTHITLAVAAQQLTQAEMNGPEALLPQRSVLFSATFTY
jgi:outer membrane receptor for ferrienterochelin and colicins